MIDQRQIQSDLFTHEYTELQKLSAEFHLLQKMYEFEYEFIEDDKLTLLLKKDGATIKITSSQEREFHYKKAIESIPLNFNK